jgi:uncharacterized protein
MVRPTAWLKLSKSWMSWCSGTHPSSRSGHRFRARGQEPAPRNDGHKRWRQTDRTFFQLTRMDNVLAGRIAALLDMHHVMSLATIGPNGPHAVNLFYARNGFTLLWVSDPSSRHSAEIDADSRVAATIAADFSDFPQVQGLQLSGHAARITDEGVGRIARHHLESRYPFLQVTAAAPAELREAYERAEFYQLTPERIVLIDNTRRLGFKQTLEFTHDSREVIASDRNPL